MQKLVNMDFTFNYADFLFGAGKPLPFPTNFIKATFRSVVENARIIVETITNIQYRGREPGILYIVKHHVMMTCRTQMIRFTMR